MEGGSGGGGNWIIDSSSNLMLKFKAKINDLGKEGDDLCIL
jgi:hypothetical protein